MRRKIIGVTVGTPISVSKIGRELKPEIKEYIDEQLGDVETALDELHTYAQSLVGGDTV